LRKSSKIVGSCTIGKAAVQQKTQQKKKIGKVQRILKKRAQKFGKNNITSSE